VMSFVEQLTTAAALAGIARNQGRRGGRPYGIFSCTVAGKYALNP